MMSKRHSKSNSNRSSHHRGGANSNQSNKNNSKKHGNQGGAGQTGAQSQNQNAPGSKPDTSNYNGVYLNKSMSHALTALVGTKVVVKVRNQEHVYEGFFHCFSQNMDLVVSGVHKLEKAGGDPTQKDIIDEMIFAFSDVVTFYFDNTDLTYAVEDNFTDNAIAKQETLKISTDEKYNNLEAWTPDPGTQCDIDGDLGEVGSSKMGGSGWAAEDMFKKNANEFGVKSDYDSTLTGYTVKLEKDNISEYSKRRADALASQIEAQANYGVHLQHELDENMDEETKFSAVDESKTNKYVPPSRRQPEAIKVNGTPPPNAQPKSTSRQNSRNNSESERKNSLNQKSAPSQSQIKSSQPTSTNPTPPSNLATTPKDKKETKKQNPRASPVTNDKNRVKPAPTGQQGKQAPPPAKPAWNTIAGASQQQQNAPPPQAQQATQAPPKKELGNKANEIADMQKFGKNFILGGSKEQTEQKVEIKGRKTTPPPGMAPKSTTGPPPGIQATPQQQQQQSTPQHAPKEEKSIDTTPKKTTKLNPNAQEWRPNVSAPAFTPKAPTAAATTPQQQQTQYPPKQQQVPTQPQTPNHIIAQSPPMHQPYPPYAQPAMYANPYFTPNQQFVQMPQQTPHMMPQPNVAYAPTNPPVVTQAGAKPRPGRPDNRIRHQNPTGSPNAMNPQQQAQVAAMQAQQSMMSQNGQNPGGPTGPPPGQQPQPGQPANPAQMAAMYQQGVQAPPPGVQQQPGSMVGVYDGMVAQGMPGMTHVGIPHRQAFDPSQGYPQGMPHMAPPTSQGSGQVVYHNGHPHQPGPGQMSIPPGATPGAIIHYQLTPNGQQGMPMHPHMYPGPRQIAPNQPGGYPNQPHPGQ